MARADRNFRIEIFLLGNNISWFMEQAAYGFDEQVKIRDVLVTAETFPMMRPILVKLWELIENIHMMEKYISVAREDGYSDEDMLRHDPNIFVTREGTYNLIDTTFFHLQERLTRPSYRVEVREMWNCLRLEFENREGA